jgi:hypothetical protein
MKMTADTRLMKTQKIAPSKFFRPWFVSTAHGFVYIVKIDCRSGTSPSQIRCGGFIRRVRRWSMTISHKC